MKSLIITLLVLLMNGISWSQDNLKNPPEEEKKIELLWLKVDSLQKKGLYRMALNEVNTIFELAGKIENHQQVIKAVLYQLKYYAYLEEDDYVKGIALLDDLIKEAPSPSKEILHSLTAEVYWGYYSSNQWKFQDRTHVGEVKLEDIRTWDLKRIAEKVKFHYLKSLMNSEHSKKEQIGDYKEIASYTDREAAKNIQPTLFDFLAHRALDFFKNNQFNVPGPAETFVMEDERLMGANSSFMTAVENVVLTDSLNTDYYAVRILYELTRFHSSLENKQPLFAVELERIKYIHSSAALPDKEALYYTALERLSQAYQNYPFSSEAHYEIATIHSNKAANYNFLGDTTNRWEYNIALNICNKTIEQFPKAYGSQQCKVLINNILTKQLNLKGEEAIGTQEYGRFLLEYRNVNKFYYKIVPYDYEYLLSSKHNYEKLVEILRKSKGVHQQELDLILPDDHQTHTTEIVIPQLENGFYYIVISSHPEFDQDKQVLSFLPFWASDITFQLRNGNGKQTVLVTNRESGKPLSGAQAKVTYKKYNYTLRKYESKTLGKYETNEDGQFSFSTDNDYYNYYVEVKDKDQVYAPNSTHYAYGYYDYNNDRVQTHFFTDRTIYRPGQTIYFKGIVIDYEEDQRILKENYKTTVYFYDANNQELDKKEVTTNQFGSFSGEFTAPFGVLTGSMRIKDAYGSASFRVEEYKRPKFNVEMDPVEGEFRVEDEITVKGRAKAFAGNAIDGAKVTYRVTRSTSYYNHYYWWSYWRPYEAPKEIAYGELVTDENGEFKVNFEAVPDKSSDPKDLPIFTYTVQVDVTDINGETHSNSSSVNVGYQSLKLGNNLKAQINAEEPFQLVISTTNLNGQDVSANGTIKVEKLNAPNKPLYNRLWQQPDLPLLSEKAFKEKFPKAVYADENNQYKWPVEKKVFQHKFNTEVTDSIDIKDLKRWQPGVYKYTAVAKDKNGIKVENIFFFTLFTPSAEKTPANEVFWLKELKTKAEPGEKITLLLGTAEEEIEVFYDIEVKNEIVESNRFKLTNEQKKIDFEVKEEHRGNFTVHFSVIKSNRKFGRSITITVPYTNKQLDLEFSTFRNKLIPGQDEEWTLTIKNTRGEAQMAELMATLYDASLDELFTPNNFYLNIYNTYYGNKMWGNPLGFSIKNGSNYDRNWNKYLYYPSRYFPRLNYHGFTTYYYGGYRGYNYDYYLEDGSGFAADMETTESLEEEMDEISGATGKSAKKEAVLSANQNPLAGGESRNTTADRTRNGESDDLPFLDEDKDIDLSGVKVRSNFNETAFFYPQLLSDEEGNVKIKFTIPESLTKWKFAGLAHTNDLKIGTIQEEVVTQKDLMVVPNAPRFLREGDEIVISTKISNVSEVDLEGAVQLELIDPFTEKEIDGDFKLSEQKQTFSAEAGKSTSVSWKLQVPYETSAVKYRIVAAAGDFSDGEESVLPILSNRMLVTESMPMPIRGNESKNFTFEKLKNSGQSKTLKHHRYTVEFTSNPAWYALQAMPYMMEYPHECAEQVFTRYYSNAIASHIMNSNPKIQKIIEDWGQNSPDAFLSNLQKNQELKAVMLEETPWVLNAKSEEQTKKNLSILLDMDRMSKELDKALGKTIQNQSSNGGWPWFPGMKESRYITQHIITGMGHLDHLGIQSVKEDKKVWRMIEKGVNYLDGEIVSDYRAAKKYDPNYKTNQHIGYTQIQYLYARSYFKQLKMDKNTLEAVNYYKDQAIKFWLNFNIYGEGMLALAAHRFEMKELATDIVKSLKDRSIQHEEFGMYWKDYQIGYYWYQAPIETQALMIEMFDEVTNDQESVEELKIWLLKQKQTTHWKTTKQTTESVYALLLKGTDLLASDELVEITVGGQPIEYVESTTDDDPYKVKAEAGTGYFKTAWTENQVKPKMGDIKVTKKDKGIAWGAAYWQYFEDLDKITFAETNLKLKKDLFLISITGEGEELIPVNEKNQLEVGQKLRVRIELRTDRNLEYVHMKDMRASGFEPVNVLSQHKYQDGLGYYEATKDAATHFFIDYIPKGTYVFEYDLRVQHKGNFSNGITTIQCMYAPEFTSHSDGIRVKVK